MTPDAANVPPREKPYQYPQGHVPKHSVSVAAVVQNDDGQVLLIERADNGNWEIPGGIVEMEEDLLDALVREVQDETGVTIQPGRLTGIYKNLRYGVVALVFSGRAKSGTAKPTPEARSVEYVAPEIAANRVSERMRPRIVDALAPQPTNVPVRSSSLA